MLAALPQEPALVELRRAAHRLRHGRIAEERYCFYPRRPSGVGSTQRPGHNRLCTAPQWDVDARGDHDRAETAAAPSRTRRSYFNGTEQRCEHGEHCSPPQGLAQPNQPPGAAANRVRRRRCGAEERRRSSREAAEVTAGSGEQWGRLRRCR